MILPILALILGLVLLVWSADRFVDGAAAVAKYFGVPALIIGMVVVGFGTSAPEMVVSAISALNGSPEIALGNAYGSNITNIALILGVTALISPIAVGSQIMRKQLPILAAITGLSAYLLWDNSVSFWDAIILLVVFALLMSWTIYSGLKQKNTASAELEAEESIPSMSIGKAFMWLIVGLAVLVGSSQLLVYGAVEIATALGVDQLIIGLTIVAVGTSLPELASSVAAARKGEHDIAIGNVIGSNFFNTLAVVGIAGSIRPMTVAPEIFTRDILVMSLLTLSLFIFGFSRNGKTGRINRIEGGILLLSYIAYTAYLVWSHFL